jgi:iron uptake system component EfeO
VSARTAIVAACGLLTTAGIAGCGSAHGSSGDTVAVTATDSGCRAAFTTLTAGTTTFAVTNAGNQVTEFYVYGPGEAVKGEVENIGPGVTRQLTVELPAGSYQGACKPGMRGDGIRVAFTVGGSAAPLADDPALREATERYRSYVVTEATALLSGTTSFVTAVKAGEVNRARALYPVARTHWERIEPVAEKFGDLDAAIDARENDVPAGAEFTGFHRLERELWAVRPRLGAATDALADRLLADVRQVVAHARTVKPSPLDLANGSKELLDEVARTKLTGEEDRYSHTDLWDIAANVDGARAAIDALHATLAKRDPQLLEKLETRFDAVRALLDRYRVGDGYRPHTTLTRTQVKELADAVNALAEPISRVGAVVAAR